MASTRIEVGSILGKRHNRSATRLKPSGTLYAQIVPFTNPTSVKAVQFQLIADLKQKVNPYYEVHRRDYFDTGALWTPIYRSSPLIKERHAHWEACVIGLHDIVSHQLNEAGVEEHVNDSLLRIQFWDHRKTKRHAMLGSLETTLAGLRDACKSETVLYLTKGDKVGEEFTKVMSVDFIGGDEEEEEAEEAVISDRSVFVPVPVPQAPSPPTFVDYITGGCDLDLSVAIDFTSSNGDPRIPGTPHYIDQNSLNEYEKAIIAIGSLVVKYDTDQLSNVYGFGAKYEGAVRHMFQVGDTAQVEGVQGILSAYRTTFGRGVTMSSPVVYTDVMKVAANRAQRKFDKALSEGKQSYSILLILTHGSVSDVNATKAMLKAVANAPLSIILVGVGENDFSAMKFLDDFQTREGGRDICNFVKFDAGQDRATLTRNTLYEIPSQLVSYFTDRGISPLKPDMDDGDIAVDDDYADVDVKHSFDSSGGLRISDSSTAYLSHDYQQ